MTATFYGHRGLPVPGIGQLPLPVHRLVYETWAGEILADLVIHHVDGDPSNNDLENLQPITREQNARYGRNLARNNTSGYSGWKVAIRVGKRDLHLGYAEDISIAAAMRAKANIVYDFSQAPRLPCGNPALVPGFDPLDPLGRKPDHHLSKYYKYTSVQVSNNRKRYIWVNRSVDRDTVRAWRDELFAKFGMKMSLNGSVTKIENTELLEEEPRFGRDLRCGLIFNAQVKAGNVSVTDHNVKKRKEREQAKEKAKEKAKEVDANDSEDEPLVGSSAKPCSEVSDAPPRSSPDNQQRGSDFTVPTKKREPLWPIFSAGKKTRKA
ncbi:hypothetical protein HDU88_007817 [Geranomyces variabilis]|nr:hypothetical protein HDU88_007817 [Geranomyces variabilis]